MRRNWSHKTALARTHAATCLGLLLLFCAGAVFAGSSLTHQAIPDIFLTQTNTKIGLDLQRAQTQVYEPPYALTQRLQQSYTPPKLNVLVSSNGQAFVEPTPAVESALENDPKLRAFLITNWMEEAQLTLEGERAQLDYTRKLLQYQSANLDFTRNVFAWNSRQSVWIFVIAHVLLLTGIGAAAYEFYHTMRLRQQARKQDEIKIELEGVALKTSLRAIWLLVSAFVFYFLYIKFVYTLTAVP